MRCFFGPLSLPWLLFLLVACGSKDATVVQDQKQQIIEDKSSSVVTAKTQTFNVVGRTPHDTTAFTQGLLVAHGMFYESTGLNGRSSIRKVEIKSGKIIDRTGLDPQYFAEGLALLAGKLYQLTWLNQKVFIYDAASLTKTSEFSYMGEGWGLATDGTVLYMSNGTDVITVHDPSDFHQTRAISVQLNGHPCGRLNELEWVEGELWANVWQTESIVRIDVATGMVVAVIDCSGIYPLAERNQTSEVMNGIAYDADRKAVYVTGKNWPWVYQIEVK
jgi:glutaminyl-peptide cyclotransferase